MPPATEPDDALAGALENAPALPPDRAPDSAHDDALPHDSTADEYATAVLALVRQIPSGRAMTYGLIAEIVAETLHRGGPRQVGQVMAGSGDRYAHLVPDGAAVIGPVQDTNEVPWWRVVNASGAPPARHATAALDALRAEATPLTRDGHRVALKRAIWFPGIDDAPR
ncbi:MGMT family protein [Xylanimonas sp. McL0601]|uniref:MGMT family protein n=1 Tax=Xylanimonas sp. McL0601 TaxID=3414739 RepID=UPI003CE8BC30